MHQVPLNRCFPDRCIDSADRFAGENNIPSETNRERWQGIYFIQTPDYAQECQWTFPAAHSSERPQIFSRLQIYSGYWNR